MEGIRCKARFKLRPKRREGTNHGKIGEKNILERETNDMKSPRRKYAWPVRGTGSRLGGGGSMRSERWAETEADPLNQAGRGAWVFFTGKALEKFKQSIYTIFEHLF